MPFLEDSLSTDRIVAISPFRDDLKEIAFMCHELTAELDIIARDKSDYGGISEDSYYETLPVSMALLDEPNHDRC